MRTQSLLNFLTNYFSYIVFLLCRRRVESNSERERENYRLWQCSAVVRAEQRRYCTTRKELLAVIKFTHQFRNYLLGREFTIRTDHHCLVWLMNFKHPQNQIAHWLEELSQYNMRIVHRQGKKHLNADALSRDIPDSCQSYSTKV